MLYQALTWSVLLLIQTQLGNGQTVRLVGGNNALEGRVGVYHNRQWGTVCDYMWNANAAKVVCRMLGFSGGQAFHNAYFGEGSGTIWIGHVECTGSESNINLCTYILWGAAASHSDDAGVRCEREFLDTGEYCTIHINNDQIEIQYCHYGCCYDYGVSHCCPDALLIGLTTGMSSAVFIIVLVSCCCLCLRHRRNKIHGQSRSVDRSTQTGIAKPQLPRASAFPEGV